MDYIKDVTVERVKAVLKTENIDSSFIYCELAQHNSNIIDQIESSKASKDVLSIWQHIENSDYINYKINPENINKEIHEFKSLTLEEQKQFLIEILDKNQLYVNYSDIEDKDYQISSNDKELNKQFYGE
jgi:adenine-specific DNA-methyltransferase